MIVPVSVVLALATIFADTLPNALAASTIAGRPMRAVTNRLCKSFKNVFFNVTTSGSE